MATNDGEASSINCSSGTEGNVIFEISLSTQEIVNIILCIFLNIIDSFLLADFSQFQCWQVKEDNQNIMSLFVEQDPIER